MRILNTMDRPENLFDAVEHDAITGFFAGVICREAAMLRRMPVLRCKDQLEPLLQLICHRNDFITPGHRQSAAGQKIILKIDDNQRVHWVDGIVPSRARSILIVARAMTFRARSCKAPASSTAKSRE